MTIPETLVTILGGGAVGSALTKLIETRGHAQTRHADELTLFRKELRDELATSKAEARREISELKAKCDALEQEQKKQSEDFSQLRLDFAVYRERVRLLIKYFRDGNTAWKELADNLEEDEHDVDAIFMQGGRSGVGVSPARPRVARPLPNIPRVLVVDDNKDTGELLRYVLEREGYEADFCIDPVKSVQVFEDAIAEGHPYDLAILDYSMPLLDGEQVARLIRIASGDSIRIAFYTGNDRDMTPGAAEIEGAEIWKKPLDSDEILKRVKALLERTAQPSQTPSPPPIPTLPTSP